MFVVVALDRYNYYGLIHAAVEVFVFSFKNAIV